jgi:hypothetical protein
MVDPFLWTGFAIYIELALSIARVSPWPQWRNHRIVVSSLSNEERKENNVAFKSKG